MQKTANVIAYEKLQNDFHKVCKEFRDKIAITYYKKDGQVEECSYAQMQERVLALSYLYQNRGIQRGDRVAVLIPLCTNAYLDILALAYMGATVVVLDINLHEKELLRILEDADVSCIITVNTLYQAKMTQVTVPVFEAADACNVLKEGSIAHASDPNYDAIAILYSSGTTSKAKGVVIGYEQEINAMDYLLEVVGTTDIRYLMLFPNSHVSGFTDFLVLLLRGGQLATMEDASATQLMQGFQLYKPNTFGMVPKVWETFKCKIEDGIREKGKRQARTIFGLIAFCGGLRKLTGINLGRKLFHSINEQVFGGNLISVHSGGGKSNPEVMRFFWNLGYDCFDFYASTEANIPIMVTDGKKYMDSVGRVDANPNAKIRVWNPDENGIGEIQVKSNTMMLGYFRNPELTKEAFEGEYFKTGDYGKIVKNEVYITGRIKESIHLRNGEKVSPDDVEEMYKQYLPADLEYAVVGIPDGDSYDKIAVFVVAQSGEYDSVFAHINKAVAMNYQCKKLEYVDALPKTSVGKVKRIALRNKYAKGLLNDEKKPSTQHVVNAQEDEIENTALANPKDALEKMLSRFTDKESVQLEDKLKDDLGMDSLNIFEMCIEFEKLFDVNIQNQLQENSTVQELLSMIQNKNELVEDGKTVGIDKYPVKRRKKDWRCLDCFTRWSRKVYDFRVEGLGQINLEENYIFAPNHESHFDGMLMVSTMPRRMQDRICSMAADYLFENRFLKPGTVILGGIPVDRTGNPTRATKRIYDLLNSGNYSLLIHPEGTRTRNGKMGQFKSGAAELSKKTGIKIVPVAICGAWDVFPPDRKLPKFGKNEKGQKYPITVKFGTPMNPEDYENAEKMTQELYDAVVQMKTEKLVAVNRILKESTNCKNIVDSNLLMEDLGMDSLAIMELFVRLDREFHTALLTQIKEIKTVADIKRVMEEESQLSDRPQTDKEKCKKIDYAKFPSKRTKKIDKSLKQLLEDLRCTYEINVKGLQNISKDTNCIICANHESYLDPYWLLAGFGDDYLVEHKFASFAAIHTMADKEMFQMIGGIPVDREGNTLPAMERGRVCLAEGYDLIIFPEGARSRDGSMLEFKRGAAELAIQCQVPILPIRMKGGFEIFPRHEDKPRKKGEKGERLGIEIIIGEPIWSENMTSQEFTNKLKQTIETL